MAPEVKPGNTFLQPQLGEAFIKPTNSYRGVVTNIFVLVTVPVLVSNKPERAQPALCLKEQLARVFTETHVSPGTAQSPAEHRGNSSPKGQVSKSPKFFTLRQLEPHVSWGIALVHLPKVGHLSAQNLCSTMHTHHGELLGAAPGFLGKLQAQILKWRHQKRVFLFKCNFFPPFV